MASAESVKGYERLIREIPDFPQQGILFRDIMPLLHNPGGFAWAVDNLAHAVKQFSADVLVAVEARGYFFAAPIAYQLGLALTPVRKVGKLPFRTISVEYALEYGSEQVEIHEDGILPGQRVVLVDDVLATGGTLKAAEDLVRKAGGETVGAAVLIELADLSGRDKLGDYPISSLINL